MIFSSWRTHGFRGTKRPPVPTGPAEPMVARPLAPKVSTVSVVKRRQETPEIDHVLQRPQKPVIPLNLFQTWFTLDLKGKMAENVARLKSQNPEFTHYLFDDDMCRNFIRENFDGDVLYTFDKLTPGAYKADLWRYCVLYKKGGIYLDIKYVCADNFKLIEIADKEYFVEDFPIGYIPGLESVALRGIYQALLVVMPMNEILGRCIKEIVRYAKEDCYSHLSPLAVSGPSLLARMIDDREVSLTFTQTKEPETIHHIYLKDREILRTYSEYRKEQSALAEHYTHYYLKGETFRYPTLLRDKKKDFSRTFTKDGSVYLSRTPSIVAVSKKYMLMNINYGTKTSVNELGIFEEMPFEGKRYINSSILLDHNFETVSMEYFNDFNNESNSRSEGLRDVHLFCHRKKVFYMGNDRLNDNDIITMSQINPLSDSYALPFRPIELEDWSKSANQRAPNLTYWDSDSGLFFIQKWYPLRVVQLVNGTTATVVETMYTTPYSFKNVQSSPPGVVWKNEVWFILKRVHTNEVYTANRDKFNNVVHFFAVFSKSLKLLRYSEPFKIDGERIENVGSLIITDDHFVLSHSGMDRTTSVSMYHANVVLSLLRWNTPSSF
jgi:hypothetical protein